MNWANEFYQGVKQRLLVTSFDNLVWLVDIMPSTLGFSVRSDKIHAPFWIIHLGLLLYVYGAGCLVYSINYANGSEDFIKCYVNISLLILIANICWWWIVKRPILRDVLTGIEEADKFARSSEAFKRKYTRYIRRIKIFVLIFYAVHFIDAFLIYIPHRADVHHDYSMVPCVGMDDIDSAPYKQICTLILMFMELSISTSVLNYQAILLFVITHTSAMFNLLTEELMALNNYSNLEEHKLYVREYFPTLIKRHVIILGVFDNLKLLYSFPIGVDFASNAICISLFFYISFKEWLKFVPVLVYCFTVFFMYCFLCQKMTDASENFENAVYSCGWENFHVKEKRLVYLMMMQAQKPVILLAADIIPVNMYTFATTLQFMFKFIAVVNA